MPHAPFRDYYRERKEEKNNVIKIKMMKYRRAVIRHYTNNTFKCNCCGEDQYDFMTVDHINNDGKEHRINEPSAANIYSYLFRRGFPEGYQILCWNCNSSKNKNGECIHKIIENNK